MAKNYIKTTTSRGWDSRAVAEQKRRKKRKEKEAGARRIVPTRGVITPRAGTEALSQEGALVPRGGGSPLEQSKARSQMEVEKAREERKEAGGLSLGEAQPNLTIEELQKQADYLSKVPKPIYKLFQRWGIPSEVARLVKRK